MLVTGGAGFLATHLCRRLLDHGYEVLCIDNFSTGTCRNIEDLLDNRRFEVLSHNVTCPLFVDVDEIYNLACPASPIHYQWDPVQTTKTSVSGVINMPDLTKRLCWNDSGVLRRQEVISPRDEVHRLTGRFYGEVLRMVIWPEASSAQKIMVAISATQ